MEILIIIGLLCYFWPVILGSLIILNAIITSVYFWTVVGILVLWRLIAYLCNKKNNNNENNEKSKKQG